jgi:hypothetical protein
MVRKKKEKPTGELYRLRRTNHPNKNIATKETRLGIA